MGGGGARGRRHRVLQAFNPPCPRWAGAILSAPQTQQVGLLGTERLAPHPGAATSPAMGGTTTTCVATKHELAGIGCSRHSTRLAHGGQAQLYLLHKPSNRPLGGVLL